MHRGNNPNETNPLLRYAFVFDGEVSDWSSTQTVNIIPKLASSAGATTTPTTTETPAYSSPHDAKSADNLQVNDLVILTIAAAAVIIAAIIAVAAVLIKRTKNTNSNTSTQLEKTKGTKKCCFANRTACAIATTKQQRFPLADLRKQSLASSYRR